MSNLIAHASDLLREMDRDGDGWYGRASSVLQDLLARVAELELRRSETVAMCVQLQAENARLQEYLEASAWRISPAMAQAKVDELNATVERLTADQLRAEIARLHEVRNKVEAGYAETVAQLQQKLTTVTAELEAFIAGGVTEELLRRQGGYLKVGKGCVLVREDDWDALLADHLGDANNKVCIWTENKDGQYETACGQMHEFFDGGPKDNHLQFCGYCGKGLIEQRWNL